MAAGEADGAMSDDIEQTSEVARLRSHFLFPSSHIDADDESLQAAIDGAKEWIGARRWSWQVVASYYLRDGSYHA